VPLSVQCSRLLLFIRVASVVVCDSVDERWAAFGSRSELAVTLGSMAPASCPHALAFLFPGDAGVDAGGAAAYGRSGTQPVALRMPCVIIGV
jgi:hypothetical protein